MDSEITEREVVDSALSGQKGGGRVRPETGSAKKLKPGMREISLLMVFQLLQLIAPGVAAYMAYHLWFHPGRKACKKIPEYVPRGMRTSNFTLNRKTVFYWCAGNGPSVLLVHGWGSCGRQMAPVAQALLDKGFRVICLDAPAHGESTGWQTSMFEVSQAICQIQQREGEFEAVLAHSFGVPCSLHAMQNGLLTRKLVAISTPATATGLIDKFTRIIKANRRTHKLLSQRVDRFIGELSLEDIAAETMARDIKQECLVIHDKHDRMIRSSEGRAVQNNLRRSHFLQTERLGHNRILKDPEVISSCIMFIAGEGG